MSFLGNDRGNVAIIFSLALLPIMLSVGVATDYVRAARIKGDLQKATDAAALAVAAQSGAADEAAAQKISEQFFSANFDNDDEKTLAKVTVQRKTDSVTVQASAVVKTTFLSLFQINSLPVAAAAQGSWSTDKIEIALALDNTGSMGSKGKLPALKNAVKSLLSTLENSGKQADSFRVAIVPFATQVNVGATNGEAGWLYMDGILPELFGRWLASVEWRVCSRSPVTSSPCEAPWTAWLRPATRTSPLGLTGPTPP